MPSYDGIEAVDVFMREHVYAPHRHDTYTVGYTFRGAQRFRYRGEARTSLPGQAFVLHPDEVHDGGPGTEAGYGYRAIYLSPDLVLAAGGRPDLPFVGETVMTSRALSDAVDRFFLDQIDVAEPMDRDDALVDIADALLGLADHAKPRRHSPDRQAMRKVRDYLIANPASPRPLSDLETIVGLDRYTIARGFRQAFGTSPSIFLRCRKLDIAKRCIRSGMSLAEAALTAGFSDQSHLTRQFRKSVGLSPGRWRRMLVDA